MTNPVNILRSMARQNPAWRNDPRWIKGMRRMRRLVRKFKKERARRKANGESVSAADLQSQAAMLQCNP